MLKIEPISEAFSQVAVHPIATSEKYVRKMISKAFPHDLEDVATRVCEALEAMGLPFPALGAVVPGAMGMLIPLDNHGLMLRIEQSDSHLLTGKRIDAHPMILQPLGRRNLTDGVVLEICAGCRMTTKEEYSRLLVDKLPLTGVEFWDDGVTNIGLLPFKTEQYPEGVPVVIDRLAVDKLSDDIAPVAQALDAFGLQKDMQAHYQPLKDAFANAWPENAKMPDAQGFAHFLSLCEEFKARGDLIAGWAEYNTSQDASFEEQKSHKVAQAGERYAHQIAMRHISR